MRRRLGSESGQSLVMTVVFLVVLVGAVALTIDFGAWYRQQRQAQATADAAALAGAQALPMNPSQAIALTEQYAAANGGGIAPSDISIQNGDTVVVHATRTSPSFFARLFSFGTVTVRASAAARSTVPSQVYGAAPIVVNVAQSALSGAACGQATPCFGSLTTIPLGKKPAPGAFGLLDFNQAQGTTGTSTLAQWIDNGYPGYLKLGDYDSDPGASYNALQSALDAMVGKVLLFPVYNSLSGEGANAAYNVVGWAGFHLDSTSSSGDTGSVTGYFTQVIWDGLQSASGSGQPPDFGLYSVSLVN